MLDLAALLFLVTFCTGVCATQSASPGVRSLGNVVCVAASLELVVAIAFLCWFFIAFELAG